MPSPAHPRDNDDSPEPATPQKGSAAKKTSNDKPTTPQKRNVSPNVTPQSAPAAAAARQRGNSKKLNEPPTLLADFLMGRPSPARIAAERQRRKSVDVVKAEVKLEMKEGAVRKLQPPGGVKDRVKNWQKANAAAMARGHPDDAASEPTDVAFKGEDVESVTEEDRIRIKMRQRKRSTMKPKVHINKDPSKPTEAEESPEGELIDGLAPKKRVVSDDNWRKPKGQKHSTRKVSPLSKKSTSPPRASQKFVLKPTANPSASSKVKDWVAKVESMDDASSRSSSKSHGGSERRRHTARQGDGAIEYCLKNRPNEADPARLTPARNRRDEEGQERTDGRQSAKETLSQDQQEQAAGTRGARRSRDRVEGKKSVVGGAIALLEASADQSTASQTTQAEKGDKGVSHGDSESLLATPTRRSKSKPTHTRAKSDSKTLRSSAPRRSDKLSWASDDESNLASTNTMGSELASDLTSKTLADIPGDIPVGYSAFSELDLPIRGNMSRPRQPKVDRNSSMKGVPNVFKKVVTEGKKIIQDLNEPPKQPAQKKPPSIENWLNNTVDPFVEPPVGGSPTEAKRTTVDSRSGITQSTNGLEQEAEESRIPAAREGESTIDGKTEGCTDTRETPQAKVVHQATETPSPTASTPKTPNSKTPTPGGLKRRSATRSSSSPFKADGKRPLLGLLKEAFQGESGGHSNTPKTYQSHETRRVDDHFVIDDDGSLLDSWSDSPSDVTPTPAEDKSAQLPETAALPMLGPRLRPPTNGNHELSTIMSEEDSSAIDSDGASNLTFSTVTQSTTLSNESEQSKTTPPECGLKRKLTKHSDLVSVLSLPDDRNVPSGLQNNRSRPSQRRAHSAQTGATAEELLKEFADDEVLYVRELKTLVDGVVPVLLSQAVGDNKSADLFSPTAANKQQNSISKSVVNMGVSLEKLKHAHRKAPVTDLRRLANWAHGVVPIYNNYLSAWRLGFQDLVVNLAPIAGALNEDDSLLDALPRNDHGDVINSEGERVDVAHLLKRPLIRIKQMAKFIRCLDLLMPSDDTRELLMNFEDLQDKARRRHREETARLTDEDAVNTDTTRCRDIRTLVAMDSVTIDPTRQVSAKDVFLLDLAHSNGQRLECRVELVHRDKQSNPDDKGDVLIRETGDGYRSFLLFQPISVEMLSARTGDGNNDMVVMIRGTHHGKQWHELLTLSSDNEDQILDWLDILPVSPVPPREPEPSVVGDSDDEASPKARLPDVPVGVRSLGMEPTAQRSPEPPYPKTYTVTKRRPLPPRYHPPASARPHKTGELVDDRSRLPSFDRASPKDNVRHDGRERRGRPLSESMRPEPSTLQRRNAADDSHSGDKPPPPPVHRTLARGAQVGSGPKTPALAVPESDDRKESDRSRRRTSSPLKHEYLPSDVSSTSELSATDRSDSESSDDEIDSVDIPETELGVSIKKDHRNEPGPLFSGSDCSLTPSNSASQAGLHGPKVSHEQPAARYLASLSRWSDKGIWRDLSNTPCSIIVSPGLIEAYTFHSSSPEGDPMRSSRRNDNRPLIALDLTPLVLIRQSTTVDLEIRSSVQPNSQLAETYGGGNFRFRCHNGPDCFSLYMSVHHARLNNQKFIQLENEARFKSFGEKRPVQENDGDTSSRRRSWFGRKNSYRGSVRAPQSQDGGSTTPSSNPSASTFLKRLTVAGNLSFNLARSSVDKHSRAGSGGNSLYTSGSSSNGGTSPRSPSISIGNSGQGAMSLGTENIRIRLHLLVTPTKWEDYGNCSLQVRQPPPGWHQALRADHGLEKRVTVTTLPKRESEQPKIMLDAVLGSGCFSPMGNRGIVCGIWEEVKGADGEVGMVPATGGTGGNIKKWCFQCASATEASWVLRLVHQEVFGA